MLGQYIDLGNPAASGPGTVGYAQWLLALPGYGSKPVWADITRKTSGGTVLGTWGSLFPDGYPGVDSTGGNGVELTLPYVGGAAGVTYGDSWLLSWWFYPLVYPVLYTAIIDDVNRYFSAFYNTSGNNSFLHNFGALPVGTPYRLSIGYLSTGTTTPGTTRTYRDGVFQNSAASAGPFWTSTIAVSLGANPSGSATPGFPTARYGGVSFLRVPAGGASGDLDALATADAREAYSGYPTRLRRWGFTPRLFATSGSSPVTVALTGQGVTSAAGTTTPAVSYTLTGSSATSAEGSVSPTVTPSLTGQYVTVYGPTVIPCPEGHARQYAVTFPPGATGDFAALTGVVTVGRDTSHDEDGGVTGVWRTGYSGTTGPWSIYLQWCQPVGGTRFLVVGGNGPSGSVITYTQDTAVASCCGTYSDLFDDGSSGSGTPPDPPTVAPVGLCDGCGDMLPTLTVSQTGQASTTAAGTTISSLSYTLLGQSVTSAPGTVSVTLDVALTGLSTTTTTGTLTAELSTTLTGGSSTTTTGTITPALAAALTGSSTATEQGTTDPETSYGATLTGQSVTSSTGTLGVTITTALVGQSAAVSQGTITASSFVPFGLVYGKWQYPRPKVGSWQYVTPRTGKWAYPDEMAGRWTPSA